MFNSEFVFDTNSLQLLVGQQELPRALPGEATEQADPGAPANGRPPTEGGNPMMFFWIIILFFIVIMVMSMLGQRRERKKREAMISAVKKHDKVQTIGGVIGSIVELKPDFVVLKVDESSNTRITFARSAIQQVIKSSNASGAKEKEAAPEQS